MSAAIQAKSDEPGKLAGDSHTQFVTMTIAGQLFGIPTEEIQDAHIIESITRIPLAPKEIEGALNIRGKIVTAINLRERLGLPLREDSGKNMSIVVEHRGELYSLLIDTIGDVLSLSDRDFEKNPPTLDNCWRDVSAGVYRLDDRLMIMTNVPRLMSFMN
jgi:purine-binding chemotaxis protein CheW